jgi:hypothetical protein
MLGLECVSVSRDPKGFDDHLTGSVIKLVESQSCEDIPDSIPLPSAHWQTAGHPTTRRSLEHVVNCDRQQRNRTGCYVRLIGFWTGRAVARIKNESTGRV